MLVKRSTVVLVLGLIVVVSLPAQAQQAYYAGKTIEILVPFGAGGGTDIETRFLAPFLEKHIAGNPRIAVRNMPGGGSILGANWYVQNAKTDGLQVLATSGSTVIPFILGVSRVQYDFSRLKLVKVNGVGGVVYVSPRTGITAAKDLPTPSVPLVYGGISATGLDLATLLLFEVLGVNVRAVLGFEGRGPARLAFERGETNIDYQTTPAYLTQVIPLVKEGKAVPIVSFGFLNERGVMVRDPAAPDLLTPYEAYQALYQRKPDGLLRWKALGAMVSTAFAYQKALWVPQGTPDEALRALHEGIDRMNRDLQFKVQSKQVLEGYTVFRGDQLEPAVLRSMRITLDVKKYITDLVQDKYKARI
jgi:tripartite-type tricarboxylate transporter receptor subunit TctC